MNEYDEIDLMDLLFYYLKKWRWIVTVMIVLAVVMGIFKYQETITENVSRQKMILEEKTKEREEADTGEKDIEILTLEDPKISAAKASISGMVMGIFLTMIFIMPVYILCGKLQNIERFHYDFGIPVLGNICVLENSSKVFSFIDRWILQLEKGPYAKIPYKEQVQIAASNIQNAIRKEELKKIMLAGTISEEEAEDIYSEAVSEIVGVTFSDYKQVAFQASALKEMGNYDGILFIEKKGRSYSKYIKLERDLAMDRGIKILGAVIF